MPPSLPDWVDGFLLVAAGSTPYGDPRLRIVWSEDRRLWADGPKKYPAIKERWVCEQWLPASTYGSPRTWAYDNPTRPYPARGEYEHLDTIEERGVCECGDKLEPKFTPGIRRVDFDPCPKCGTITKFLEPQRPYMEHLVKLYANAMELIKEQVKSAETEEMVARAARVAARTAQMNEDTPNWGRPLVGLSGHPLPFTKGKHDLDSVN